MRKEVLWWWEQAQKDLEVADKNLQIEEYYVTVFYCQQAVEKGLKSLYILEKSRSPGQTHSLIHLGKEVRIPKAFLKILQELTPTFVTTRYPDAVQEVPYKLYGRETAKDFLSRSKVLFRWLENQINKH